MMTLKKAVKMLEEEYERAKQQEWILDPIGYALYETWKKAYEERNKKGVAPR